MKITDSKATTGVRATRAVTPGKAPPGQAAPVAATKDSASIMGIPEAEFTPKVREAIMNLMQEVDKFRQELERATRRIDHLEKLVENDTLTRLLNRRGFVREMTRIKGFVDRYETPAALVFFDLNNFKPVNDRFGHAAGDQVLQRVADVLTENTRNSDVVGRLGGDEFGVILVNNRADAATQKAQKLAEAIGALRFQSDGEEYGVSASHGIYMFGPGDDPAMALAKADEAMYASKRQRIKS
ncbi:MAG: diguanylate cyclase [Alphaproteobacteria bacterium]|nr:diguanylate cyclase [Alphaproteobacteria bacterium]